MLAGCVIFYNGGMREIPYISLEVLLRSLAAEREALVVRAVRDVMDELSEYRTVPRDDLVASVAAVFDAAMLCLGSSDPVDAVLSDSDNGVYGVAPRRKLQGVSLASVLRAHRLALSATQQRFVQMAEKSGLPFDKQLQALGVMWEVGEWFMVRAAQDYEPAQLTNAEQRQIDKKDFLTRLYQGALAAEEVHRRACHLGLPESQEYRVVLGRGISSTSWSSGVEAVFSTTLAPALAAEVEGSLVGIVPALDGVDSASTKVCERQDLESGAFAFGGAVSLEGLGSSLAEACVVLASLEPDMKGCFDAHSRGWRLAVAQVPWLGGLLEGALLEPLRNQRAAGEGLLVYVWAFLEHRRSYREAAQALYIHENTLRNKVAKFEQNTGLSVNDIDTCIELMWLRHDMSLKGKGVGVDGV